MEKNVRTILKQIVAIDLHKSGIHFFKRTYRNYVPIYGPQDMNVGTFIIILYL